MKNVVILFLFLCVNLADAFHYVHAGVHNERNCSAPMRDLEKKHQVEGATKYHDYFLTVNTSSSGNDSNLVAIEDEDDNEDIIKKHVSQVRYFLPFCYAFVLNSRFSFLEKRLPSGRHLSYTSFCKYILQRALRI